MPKSAAKKAKRAAKHEAKKEAKKAVKHEIKKEVFQGKGDYQKAVKRTQNKMFGRGDFFSDAVDWVSEKTGDLVKSGVKGLGKTVGKVFGMGDYKVGPLPKVNSLKEVRDWTLLSGGGKAGIFRKREPIANVQSSAGFQINSISFNPGLPGTLQWASQESSGYQRYKVRGVMYEYVPSVSPGDSTGNGSGKVSLSVRYDANLQAPGTLIEAEEVSGSVNGLPCQAMLLGVECDPRDNPVNIYQLRDGAIPATQNVQFFDHHIIDIVNQGQANGSTLVGQVFCVYDLQFTDTFDSNANNDEVLTDKFDLVGVTSGANLGDGTAGTLGTLGGKIPTGTNKYYFPSWLTEGEFLVQYNVCWTTNNVTTAIGITLNGCSYMGTLPTPSGFASNVDYAPSVGISDSCVVWTTIVKVTASNAYIGLTGITMTGTAKATLIITPLAGTILTMRRTRRTRALWREEEKKMDALRDAVLGYGMRPATETLLAHVEEKKVKGEEAERGQVPKLDLTKALQSAELSDSEWDDLTEIISRRGIHSAIVKGTRIVVNEAATPKPKA